MLLAWLDDARQVPSLTAAVRRALSHPNLYLHVSNRLVQSRIGGPISDTSPVRDCILGTSIYGTGWTNGQLTTELAPSPNQAIIDTTHSRPRRGRAGAANLVPTSTGAAAATARALPEYRGKFDGVAVRAPVPVGSLADIVCVTARATTVDEVNRLFVEEADSDRYRGVLGVTSDPLVSSDIIKDPRASVVDLGMTQIVDGDMLKVMSWYDNEWGYSSQLVREALQIARTLDPQSAAREA